MFTVGMFSQGANVVEVLVTEAALKILPRLRHFRINKNFRWKVHFLGETVDPDLLNIFQVIPVYVEV